MKFKEYNDVDFIDVKINLEYFKTDSDIVVISLPGNGGTSNGYNDKYYKIAKILGENNFANMICLDNKTPMGLSNKLIGLLKLQTAIEEVINDPLKYSNSKTPKIYLFGYSDGGSLVALISSFYKQIKKILLISPSLLIGKNNLENFLPKFKGNVYILVGENDELIGKDTGNIFYNHFNTDKKIIFLPNCNHNFTGEYNLNTFIQSVIYAFQDGIKFEDLNV